LIISGRRQLNDLQILKSRIATSSSELIPVASTASTAVSSASAASITSTASTAFDLGTRLVDVQSTPANLAAVHGCDGFLSVFRARHFDEAEAPRSAGVPVRHYTYAIHLSMSLEKLAQLVFRSIEIKVANKDVLHANASQ
jgi:hypothetical protein